MPLIERLKARALDPALSTDMQLDMSAWGSGEEPTANLPLSLDQFAAAEQQLGILLPELFRRVYTEVGDGNFGPGYGLMPLLDNTFPPSVQEVVPMYLELRDEGWPAHLLPFCYWGCTVYSVLDLQQDRVGVIDMGSWDCEDFPDLCIEWQTDSLQAWLEAWLAGEDLFFEMDET